MKAFYLIFILLFALVISTHVQSASLISRGSTWKYYQAGNTPTGSWTSASYNDAAWGSGPAILAWGGLTAGTTKTTLTTGKHTIYFRQAFNYTVTGTETGMVLDYLFDDGAVVYLNGTEIKRINMGTGTVTYGTWTTNTGVESSYTNVTLPSSALALLVSGINVLAVEVHNVSSTSSDLGLDCSLTVSTTALTAACKHIRFGSSGNPLNGLTITWRSTGTADRIRWGYTSVYERGEFTGTRRSNYADYQYDYVFPSPVTPAATLYYQLYDSNSGQWTSQKTYQTGSDESAQKFNFTAMGDSRTNLTDWQAVANAANANQSDFVMFGGDITNSGSGAEYDLWFDYAPDYVSKRVFYHTVGNHELTSDPSLVNYKSLFTMPGNELYYSFNYGNAVFLVLNGSDPSNSSQLSWLQSTLAANTGKTWKIIMFHQPFYTSPSHTGEMDAYFGTIWKAFDDYGVDIILNGHTHNYQRTKPINRNVSTTSPVAEYGSNPGQGRCEIVAGAAGAPLSGAATAGLWWLQTTLNDHHYCNVAIDGNTLSFKAYKRDQTVFDQFTITKASTLTISNVQATGITETSAQITWTTNMTSSTDVDYGIGSYTLTKSGTGGVTSHSVTLTGLISGTTYIYQVRSEGVTASGYSFTTKTIQTTDYSPASVTFTKGSSSSSLSNLTSNDQVYYVVNSSSPKPYVTDWTAKFTVTNPSEIFRFTLMFDGKYSRSNTQILYLYNFTTNTWVQVDSRTISTRDVAINFVQNTPESFISSAGEIRVRVYCTSSSKNFTCSADLLKIRTESYITPPSNGPLKSAGPGSLAVKDFSSSLLAVYPNPASDHIRFRIFIPAESEVDLEIYNLSGVKMARVLSGSVMRRGSHEIEYNTVELTTGSYICKLTCKNEWQAREIKTLLFTVQK